jgi:ATPase subunit of ABC transporter with duplicated ATPase domains
VVLNNGDDSFKIIEMTSELQDNLGTVKNNVVHCKEVLQYKTEPEIKVGKQCTNPYLCEFKNYCEKGKDATVQLKTIDSIEIDPYNQEFNDAVDFIQHTNTPMIYLTGKAGTGKTTFLKYLRATTKKNLVVLAPTGVAAVNAGGQTIHSFFQISPSLYVPDYKRLRISQSNDADRSTIYDYFKYNKEKVKIYKIWNF